MSALVIQSLQYVRKRSGGEVHVEFHDGTKLIVDPDLSVQFQLSRGMNLTEEKHRELVEAQERLSARRRLIRHLALRKKTAREAERYLRELKFPEHAISYAITAALENSYLNDEQYAEAYTRAQHRAAKKGPRAVRQELQSKGVDRQIVEEAVKPLADPQAQRDAAMELGRKKLPSLGRETDKRTKQQKLHTFLLRKGYDSDICYDVTQDLLGALETDDFTD